MPSEWVSGSLDLNNPKPSLDLHIKLKSVRIYWGKSLCSKIPTPVEINSTEIASVSTSYPGFFQELFKLASYIFPF